MATASLEPRVDPATDSPAPHNPPYWGDRWAVVIWLFGAGILAALHLSDIAQWLLGVKR